jgi:organic hydroperoxide reductase OsmC/OhrA
MFHHVIRENARNGEVRAGAIGEQIGSGHRKGWRRLRHHLIHLTVAAKIPGIDHETFQSIAAKAKAGCPVSKLMTVEIGFEATLIS